jgi:hypothetical protein
MRVDIRAILPRSPGVGVVAAVLRRIGLAA